MATAMNRNLSDGAKNDDTTATTSSVGKILSVLRSPRRRTQRLVPKRDMRSESEFVACPKCPIKLAMCSSASSPAVARKPSTPNNYSGGIKKKGGGCVFVEYESGGFSVDGRTEKEAFSISERKNGATVSASTKTKIITGFIFQELLGSVVQHTQLLGFRIGCRGLTPCITASTHKR